MEPEKIPPYEMDKSGFYGDIVVSWGGNDKGDPFAFYIRSTWLYPESDSFDQEFKQQFKEIKSAVRRRVNKQLEE